MVFRDYRSGDDSLPKNTREAHQLGFSHILKPGEYRQHRHLSILLILKQYADAEAGVSPYQLIPEAFFVSNENIRAGRLDSLYGSVGIPSVWGWLNKHPLLKVYERDHLEGADTLQGELNELVEYRNDAAHGNPQERLSTNRLLHYTVYIDRLAGALAELLRHHVFRYYLRRCVVLVCGAKFNSFHRNDLRSVRPSS